MPTMVEPDPSSRGASPAAAVSTALRTRLLLTWLGLIFERLAPPLLFCLSVLALFLAFAWAGLFASIGPLYRLAALLPFLAAFLYGLATFRAFTLPSGEDVAQRLDSSAPQAHRPLSTLADQVAGNQDAFALALWQRHQARAAEAAALLRAQPGDAKLRLRDPLALRLVAILAMVAAAFIAGDERQARLAMAFDWSRPVIPPVPPRLDAWIDPPNYTGRPPIFLTGAVAIGADEIIRVPVGSTLTIRSTRVIAAERPEEPRPRLLALRHDSGLAEIAPPKPAGESEPKTAKVPPPAEKPGIETIRKQVIGDARVSVLREGAEIAAFRFETIPDAPPKVELSEVRAETAVPDRQVPGGIRVLYALEDDYGIAKADLVISRIARAGAPSGRTLLPPPELTISTRLGAGEAALATEDHPWAGEEVMVKLVVEDDIGQKAESQAKRVLLPRRPFTDPLARALVEQRRNLVFAPDQRQDVVFAFDALLFSPERFTPSIGTYLALDQLRSGIRNARNDAQLIEMVERLYELAQFIENGDMTDAERRLREAEARLRDAIDREAPPEEIRKLAEELRRAMEQFLREFAERSLREQNRDADQDRAPDRLLTQRDLSEMLRRIEEMARSGNTAEAQRLLNELRQLLESLRTARRQDNDPRRRELGRQLQELDKLQREQRDLRDRTFRDGQQRNQQGQRQQGQRQQGQRQPGQKGDQQGEGEGEDLQKQQQALRERLQQLRDRLKQNGLQEGEGFGEAENGMGDAEGQLGQGQPGQATEGQQRALDGLDKAAQGMAQQLDQQAGEGEGEGDEPGSNQPGPGNRGRADNRTDPLGRPQPNARRDLEDNSRVRVPDQNTTQRSIGERAEQVLKELRKRLGEFERPRDELDYFERLLKQR